MLTHERVRLPVLSIDNRSCSRKDILTKRMGEKRGETLLGVDENQAKLKEHWKEGRRVVDADASDPDFWANIHLDEVEQVMLALTNHAENKLVGKQLRESTGIMR